MTKHLRIEIKEISGQLSNSLQITMQNYCEVFTSFSLKLRLVFSPAPSYSEGFRSTNKFPAAAQNVVGGQRFSFEVNIRYEENTKCDN